MTKTTSWIIVAVLIGVGVFGRLVAHIPNMTPLVAIALFCTTYLSLRYSLIVFASTMILTDIVIGIYQWQIMLAVYISFALVCCIGLLVKRTPSLLRIIIGATSASVLFFIITNWAVWQFSGMYPLTFSGLIQSYTMALPFFKNMLAGDLFYTTMLFGLMYVAVRMHLVVPERNIVTLHTR
jgi:hypothetical protein